MSQHDIFTARLDRIKMELSPQAPAQDTSLGLETTPQPLRGGPARRQRMFLPMVSSSVLAVGVLAFLGMPQGEVSGPSDLNTAILELMSDANYANLGSDTEIGPELETRAYADVNLARLALGL